MKKLMIVLLISALLMSLTACADTVPVGYDGELLTSEAQIVADTVNARDYDEIVAMFREDLQSQLTAQELSEALDETLDKSGGFVSFKKVAFTGKSDGDTGETYAVVKLTCTYENAKRVFTVSFDRNMDLIGLYMK